MGSHHIKSNMVRVLIPGLVLFMIVSIFGMSCQASQATTPTPSPIPAPSPAPAPSSTPSPPSALTPEAAEEGRALFISKACIGCHTVQGIPEAQGKVGPELTHEATNSLIAGVLPNTDENLKKWLKDPSAVKPETIMPNQNLTDREIDALLAFLQTLK